VLRRGLVSRVELAGAAQEDASDWAALRRFVSGT